MATLAPHDQGEIGSLVDAVNAKLAARFEAMVHVSPRNQPIASDIDPDSCRRRQVLEVTHWKEKAPIPGDRQGRLEVGNESESKAIRLLKEVGFRVVKEQMPFELLHRKTNEPVLRGRVDGFIQWARLEIPVEVKSLHPNVYSRINALEDLERFWFTRKHTFQLQAYMIGYGCAVGLLMLTDCLGNWKLIAVVLDYDVAERVWTYAEGVVDGIRHARVTGGLPPFTEDPTECAHCPFFGRTCNPPIQNIGAALLDDPELLADLQRWHETKEIASEHEGIDKRVNKIIRTAGVDRALAGDFAISVKPRPVKAYEVAARVDRVVTIEHLGTGK